MKRLAVMLVMILVTPAFGTSIWAQKEKPLTQKQAMALLASAEKPEEHEQLAQYFKMKAAKLEAEAKEHLDLADAYHKGKAPNMNNAKLCEEAAADERKAAEENRALADSHHKMAQDLGASAPH